MPRFLDLDEAKRNPDWEIVFGGGVNAGDAAPILWESKFEDAYGLWLLKTKQKPRPPQTDAMKHGNVTEPLIHAWYQEKKGVQGRSQVWAVYSDAEFVRGLGDFWNDELRHGAEYKAPSADDTEDHAVAKEGVVPFHYLLQCWHLMEVYDALTWDFVSWRSPDDAVVIPVQRNTDFWLTEMLPAYMEFWRRVQERSWPRPEGKVFEISEEWRMHVRRRMDAKAMEREAKILQRREEAWFKRNATAKTTVGGGAIATWIEVRPRHEIKITVDDAGLADQVMKAIEPLRPRLPMRGQKKDQEPIKRVDYPPNLWLKITGQKEEE